MEKVKHMRANFLFTPPPPPAKITSNGSSESTEIINGGETPKEAPSKRQPSTATPMESQRATKQGKTMPESPEKEKSAPVFSEQDMINTWTTELNDLSSRALAPLMVTLGMVAARLRYNDMRELLAWKGAENLRVEDRLNVVVPGARTVEEFIDKNRVLGTRLLTAYISTYEPPSQQVNQKEEKSGFVPLKACFDLNRDMDPIYLENLIVHNGQTTRALNRALEHIGLTEVERQFAPAWALQVMGDGIFRSVLSVTCLGAFEAALAQVRRVPGCSTFTLKELICSPQVSDQFAFLVSSTFLASGDDNMGQRGNSKAVYLNVMRMRRLLGDQIYTCKIWFESVYAAPNPLLAEFEREKKRRLDALVLGKEEIVQHKRYQFYGSPSVDKIERIRDFLRRLSPAQDERLRTFTNLANQFLQSNNDQQKQQLLDRLTIEYALAWAQIVDHFGDRHFAAEIRAEMEKNLNIYRDMLPQRQLVYRG
jgi:hypothetical protein